MSKLITQFVVGMVVVAFCLLSSFILTAAVLPLEHPTLASAEYKFSNHNVFQLFIIIIHLLRLFCLLY